MQNYMAMSDSTRRGLWDALEAADAGNNAALAEEPSSSATFHTASSPPPTLSPPRETSGSGTVNRMNDVNLTRGNSPSSSIPHSNTQAHRRSPRRLHPSRSVHSAAARRESPASNRDNRSAYDRTRPSYTFDHNHESLFSPSRNSAPPYDSADFDGVDIDDILNDDEDTAEDSDMAPKRRSRRGGNGDGVVDLTGDSSPPAITSGSRQPKGRKRAASGASNSKSNKRRKGHTQPNPTAEDEADIEQLDLTNEAPSAEEEIAAAQSAATILAQQPTSTGPLKIGQMQCIICMEPFTNATITHCGHIYCHECLTQALLAGEKNSDSGKANCPVCRKDVKRKAKTNVIPVAFMKRSAFKGKARSKMRVLG